MMDSTVDVAALMRAIRNEALQRRSDLADGRPAAEAEAGTAAFALPKITDPLRAIEPKASYALAEILQFGADAELVANAYRAVLGRETDPEGFAAFCGQLRAGKRTPTEIVGRIRYSAEGRARAVRVRGLALQLALDAVCHVPLLGHVVRLARSLWRLPELERRESASRMAALRQDSETVRQINAVLSQLEKQLQRFGESAARAADLASVRERAEWLQTHQHELTQSHTALARKHEALAERHAAMVDVVGHSVARPEFSQAVARLTHAIDHLLSLVEQRVAVDVFNDHVAAVRSDLGGIETAVQLATSAGEAMAMQLHGFASRMEDVSREVRRLHQAIVDNVGDHVTAGSDVLGALYIDLEDRFRGSRAEIAERVSTYLPALRGAVAHTNGAAMLDIGCGRGELLEAMRLAGFTARGVDVSEEAIRECRSRGLDVVEEDALRYLRSIPSSSLAAITAIHVIEHLPFGKLVALLDEALRVLQDGGLLILETPNPENVVVGACNFHIDPTHVRPIPPELGRFLLEARGFSAVRIDRFGDLTRNLPGAFPDDDARRRYNPFIHALRHNFFSAPDYAVSGMKRQKASD